MINVTLIQSDIIWEDKISNLKRYQEKIDKIDFSDLKRNMGIHGLLGYYGNYTFSGLGSVKVMSKSKLDLVLIQSKTNEPLVVSVDDVGFLSNF